uniref:DUF4276 family protein n=1 Tax=Chlorobium chlorochromatii (strain CaD3) TaxID=340177 RepID=Q3AT15_CHLCH
MVKSIIYLEGGGDSKELRSRCREGFRKLLERNGFKDKMPRFVACGGRNTAFSDFKVAHEQKIYTFVALWVDSEEPLEDIHKTWEHVQKRDGWEKPHNSIDEQLLFMTTCMETLIAADRETLQQVFKPLQESALPSLYNLEKQPRHELYQKLKKATQGCAAPYEKGKISFEVLGKLNAETLQQHLPSVARTWHILQQKL